MSKRWTHSPQSALRALPNAEIVPAEAGLEPTIIVARSGAIAEVTFNAPDVRNALTPDDMAYLAERLRELAEDRTVRLVSLRGAGGHFCAGGNVRGFGGGVPDAIASNPADVHEWRVQRLIRAAGIATLLRTMEKPTVALLEGSVAGAGLIYALACDFRLAAASTMFTTAFARVGTSGDMGASVVLHRLAGPAMARELLFLSAKFTATEARSAGLVHRVYSVEAFQRESAAFVAALADGPPLAFAAMKRNLIAAEELGTNEALEIEARNMIATLDSADCREAAQAFLQRRPPIFTGN